MAITTLFTPWLSSFIALKKEDGKLFWSQGAKRDNDFALSGKDTLTHTHIPKHKHTQPHSLPHSINLAATGAASRSVSDFWVHVHIYMRAFGF